MSRATRNTGAGVVRIAFPLALAVAAACGTSESGFRDAVFEPRQNQDIADASTSTNAPPPGFGGGPNEADIVDLVIEPPSARIVVSPGAPAQQTFRVVGLLADGTKVALSRPVSWKVTNYSVGNIDGLGVYTATGEQGGDVSLSAELAGKSAGATLTVTLKMEEDATGGISPAAQAALRGASQADANVKWAYPFDGTVFPRQLQAPLLMWNGAGASDLYLVSIKSPHFELERFTQAAPPSRVEIPQTTWDKFVESTTGAAELTVARYDGANASVVAKHKWRIAPASMRGSIYYWSNNRGRVLRITPGASAPEDFSANNLPGLPSSTCTTTCHSVSADGSVLLSGGDTLGGTYDLKNGKVYWDEGGSPGSTQKRRWAFGALSPTGKYVIESFAPFPVGFGSQTGLFRADSKQLVPNSGLDGVRPGTPAFAPDGSLLAYVNYDANALHLMDFDEMQGKASNPRQLVVKGALPDIAFPSVSPDSQWIIYQRGTGVRTDGGNTANLFMANAKTGEEIRLAALNGETHPLPGGARDLNWNFEPTFAPVASGGYFWVVFTSRRVYGNKMEGAANVTKQLWVAAIEQNPAPGVDPSHPAFHLAGQGEVNPDNTASLNMRGFWALEACRADGQACDTGSQCCGGYCDKSSPTPDGKGICRSAPPACAQTGDRCQSTADCCEAGLGVTCINHVCSEPTPR